MNISNINEILNATTSTAAYPMCPTPKPEWILNGFYTRCINTSTLEEALKPLASEIEFIPSVITYALAFTFGIIANLVIIYALCKDTKLNNSAANRFLISLAVADVLFLFICAPYESLIKYTGFLANSDALCKIFSFVEMGTAAASILNLTAVSFERYVVIVHPIKAREITNTRSVILIVIVWIVAGLISLPTLYIWSINSHVYYRYGDVAFTHFCASYTRPTPVRQGFAWYRLLVLYLIPLGSMAFCYIMAIKVLMFSTRSLTQMTSTRKGCQRQKYFNEDHNFLRKSSSEKKLKSKHARENDVITVRKQLMRMLMAVIALFMLSWGPKLIWDVYEEHNRVFTHSLIDFSIYVLPYIQSALNPVIYFTMSKSIRNTILNCTKQRKSTQHSSHSSIKYKGSSDTSHTAC